MHMCIEHAQLIGKTSLTREDAYLFVWKPGVSIHFARIDRNRQVSFGSRRTNVQVDHYVMPTWKTMSQIDRVRWLESDWHMKYTSIGSERLLPPTRLMFGRSPVRRLWLEHRPLRIVLVFLLGSTRIHFEELPLRRSPRHTLLSRSSQCHLLDKPNMMEMFAYDLLVVWEARTDHAIPTGSRRRWQWYSMDVQEWGTILLVGEDL